MTAHRAAQLLLPAIAAAALCRPAAAQSYAPQPQHYLLSVDGADGRSLWLQPAGLSRRREATVGLFAGGERSGNSGLTQYGALLATSGVGVGWQRDRRGSGIRNNTFTVAFAAGHARAGIGASRNWYRGTGTRDGSYTLAARYTPAPPLDLSLMWRDIGSPVILGDTVRATMVPAAAWNLLGGRARLSAEWEVVTADWGTSGVRAGASVALAAGIVLSARADFSGSLDRRGLAFALSWSGPGAVASAFATDVRGGSDPFGGYLAMVRPLDVQRRRPGRR